MKGSFFSPFLSCFFLSFVLCRSALTTSEHPFKEKEESLNTNLHEENSAVEQFHDNDDQRKNGSPPSKSKPEMSFPSTTSPSYSSSIFLLNIEHIHQQDNILASSLPRCSLEITCSYIAEREPLQHETTTSRSEEGNRTETADNGVWPRPTPFLYPTSRTPNCGTSRFHAVNLYPTNTLQGFLMGHTYNVKIKDCVEKYLNMQDMKRLSTKQYRNVGHPLQQQKKKIITLEKNDSFVNQIYQTN